MAIVPGGVPDPAPARRGSGFPVAGVAALVVLAAFGGWFVWHLLWGILHIVELVAVGVGCGWSGWRLGVGHGRRLERRGR